jgi:RimJ/RimL family protein N-acetyltransferase
MPFSLRQLSKSELEALAESRIPEGLKDRAEPESMPPAFVASRALKQLAAGQPYPWSTSFLIVNDKSNKIVGGCGFKNTPVNGRVEVGYGVAPAARGRGGATQALKLLIEMALEAGEREVMAEIVPTNLASARVVEKLGFARVGSRVDEEGERVVQWVKRCEA